MINYKKYIPSTKEIGKMIAETAEKGKPDMNKVSQMSGDVARNVATAILQEKRKTR